MSSALFLIMEPGDAEALRAATAGQQDRLEPRLIESGAQAGLYALPARVADDAAFSAHGAAFARMRAVELDIDEAWPAPAPEEGEAG